MTKTIAVDFDGTLHDWEHPKPGYKLGPPMPGAVEAMKELKDHGFEIIIHTCRANDGPKVVRVVQAWLDYFDIPYDAVWMGEGKPIADKYVDDRAIAFTNWDATLQDLGLRRGHTA